MATATEYRTPSETSYSPMRRYEDVVGPVAVRRVSWGAIAAGTAFGLIFQLWLGMLGVAIGATTVDPLREANPFSGLGTGSLVWLGISLLISSFVGGWITGRLAGIPRFMESALHGAVSWATSNIVIYVVLGGILGAVISGTAQVADRAVQAGARVAPTVADNAGAGGAVNQAIGEVQRQAQQFIDQGQASIQSGQAQQQAREAGDRAAEAVAGTTWGLVIVMFLGLCAGIGGAVVGAPRALSYARKSA